MTDSRRRTAAAALVVLAVLALGAMPVRDLDTWWSLATGRYILAAGIPFHDPFSFVLNGRPWVAFEWLADVLFWGAWRGGGPAALIALKGLAAAAGFVLAWRAGRERPFWSAFLCVLAAACCRRWLVERPFIFDLAGVGAAAALIGGSPADGPTRRAWLLVPLAALWANLHGAAGLAAGGMALSAGLQAFIQDRDADVRPWLLLAAAAGAAVLLNPNGLGVIDVALRTAAYPGRRLLYDWSRPGRDLFGPLGLWVLAGLYGVWLAWRRGSPWAVWTAAALGGALAMRRGEPLFLLCAAACLGTCCEPPLKALWKKRGDAARLAASAVAAAADVAAAVAASPQG
ncbi:MAG: hypothetical protein KGL53_07285, partial [Elusimicrobia bacterium]|nr:hypothetical protein [Elusimicrobiota bacterium]